MRSTEDANRSRRPPRAAPLVLLAVLALAVVAVTVLGLREARSSRAAAQPAPLVSPPFAAAPALRLAVLSAGRLPAAARADWRRAWVGKRVDLARLRGRPLLVNFWASWCDPCRREAPLLQRTWRRARRDGFIFVGINQNDGRGDALAFLRRFGITYPSLREPGDGAARRWRVGGFPVTFFINRNGRVVAEAIGRLRPEQLQRGLRAAEAGAVLRNG